MRGVTVNTVSASAFDQIVLLAIEMSLDAAAELGKTKEVFAAIPSPAPTSAADRSRARSKSPGNILASMSIVAFTMLL